MSSRNNWLTIDAQTEQLKMSRVDVRFDPGMRRFVGTTDNVARLAFDLDILESAGAVTVEIDGQKLTDVQVRPGQPRLWLEQRNGKWSVEAQPSSDLKGSRRYGTLKEAFGNRMILVFGTAGPSEENRWAFDKARFDAEKFWYQGNGSVDVIADVDFNSSVDSDRSVILYGNKNTNTAWNKVLSESPVQVGRGTVQLGKRTIHGDNLCCILVRPRSGSPTASVAAISGSGLKGMRLNNRLPYLSPGIGLPDCTILDDRAITIGEEGVIVTGFFGLDWSIENGEFVWGAH